MKTPSARNLFAAALSLAALLAVSGCSSDYSGSSDMDVHGSLYVGVGYGYGGFYGSPYYGPGYYPPAVVVPPPIYGHPGGGGGGGMGGGGGARPTPTPSMPRGRGR